jgi:PAS domain S-box-containing protein
MPDKPTYKELEQRVKDLEINDLSLNRMTAPPRECEDPFRTLVNLSPDPIVVIQDEQHHLINHAFTKLFGYTQEDVDNGLSGYNLIQEQDKERVAKRIKNRFAGKAMVPRQDRIDLNAKDGRIKHCETYASLIQYNGRPADLVILRNITERKEAEEALRASELKYRLLAENVADNIWVVDTDTLEITFCSPSVERILGYTDKETMTQTLGDTLTSESMEVVMSVLKDELSHEGKEGIDPSRSRTLELEQIHKNGSKVWTETTATFLRDENGKATEILGVTRDIRERKKAEERIRLFRNLVNQSNDAIFVVDPQTSRFLDVNDKACSNLEYEKEDLLKLGVVDIETIMPANFTWEEHVKNVRKNGGMILEGVHKRKDGTTFPAELNTKIIEEEKREYMVAVARDISARKQGEEALRLSQEKSRDLVETVNDIIWEADVNGVYTYLSSRIQAIFGYEPEELIGRPLTDLMSSNEADRVSDIFKGLVPEPKPFMALETTVIRKDGEPVTLETSGKPFFSVDGKLLGFRGVDRDITKRKQAEKALRESEERLSLVLQATNDGIWDWEIINDKIHTSDRFKELIGYTGNDSMMVIGTWTSRIHPDHQGRIMHELQESLDGKAPYNIDYLVRDKTGGYRWRNARGMVLFDENSKPYRMVGSLRDIHDHVEKEEHIRELTQQLIRAQEIERQRISRELHDHVAQDLAASKMTCGQLLNHEQGLTDDGRQNISKISDMLGEVITVVRDLSYDLRPPDLEEWGLSRSISLYCEDFSRKTGLDVEFHPTGIDHLILEPDAGIHIFRLMQEGLNNIWNHAHANRAIIKLVRAFPNIILRIEDNGKGFDVKKRMFQVMEEKRMGLRNMEERARLLHGQMKIQSRPKIGTIISIKFPYSENTDESKKDHINP